MTGTDVAIRFGPPDTASLIARKLGGDAHTDMRFEGLSRAAW